MQQTFQVGRKDSVLSKVNLEKNLPKRTLDDKYGCGNYGRGPGSEFNKLQKYGDRHFE